MTDLDPCLLGCDSALAEADLLIAMLSDSSDSLDPELTAVRLTITRLRREVDRLRGMPIVPARGKIHPDWIDLSSEGSPWAARIGNQAGGDQVGPDQIGGA